MRPRNEGGKLESKVMQMLFDRTLLAFAQAPTWALGASLLDSTQPEDHRPLVLLDHLCTE